MTTGTAYIAIAPNIARKTSNDLTVIAPNLAPAAAQLHQEMLEFSREFGQGQNEIPDLTITAYPQYVHNLRQLESKGNLAPMPQDLPPMRPELVELGMGEPSPYFRVIGFVPLVLAVNRHVSPMITDWSDLCRPDICRRVAVPPKDTPMPDFFAAKMSSDYGDQATEVIANINTNYTPLDINKEIDAGHFAAGVSIPAFSRTYRNDNGTMVWPRSGAWCVGLVACLKRDPHPDAVKFLRHLLSADYQNYLSLTGALIPVRAETPWPDDMPARPPRDTLQWVGWDAVCALGSPVALPNAHSAPEAN